MALLLAESLWEASCVTARLHILVSRLCPWPNTQTLILMLHLFAGVIKAVGHCPVDTSAGCPSGSGNYGFNNTGGCGNVGCNNSGTGNVGNNNAGTRNIGDSNNGSNNVGRCLDGTDLTGNFCPV